MSSKTNTLFNNLEHCPFTIDLVFNKFQRFYLKDNLWPLFMGSRAFNQYTL